MNILFTFRIFEQLRFPWKTELPWNFSPYWNIFYHSGFLTNFRLPWKQSLLWNFSSLVGLPPSPPRTPMVLCIIFFSLIYQGFLRRFRDPIRVPRIRENYHRVPKIRENRVPRIREIGSLQIHTGYLTFSLKKALNIRLIFLPFGVLFFSFYCGYVSSWFESQCILGKSTHRCTRVHIFGDAKNFCPNWILFFPNNVQAASLHLKTETYHCKQIKVSACLITNYRGSKPHALNQQSIFCITACEQW